MNLVALIPVPLRSRWRDAMHRLDAMPERDRFMLLAGALALVFAAEALVVLPTRALRQSMAAASAEQAQGEAAAAAAATEAQAQQRSTTQARIAALDDDLARLGLGKSAGEPLGFLLGRALRRQDARVLGLRELPVEDIDSTTAAATATVAATAQPAAEPASASALLYRHRFELRLAGDVAALATALRTLDQLARPLRIERVRISSADGSAIEAAITLSVVGTQRSWLSL